MSDGIELEGRLSTEEKLEFTVLILGRDLPSYLLALILHQHGYSVAILSRPKVPVMADFKEYVYLKSLYEASRRLRSIKKLSENGFQIHLNSPKNQVDWKQLTHESKQEFNQLKESIEREISSRHIPVYEGTIVLVEEDLVRIISEDERSQYAVLRTNYLLLGSDICRATVKNHSKHTNHGTVLKTLDDLMNLNELPESLAVIGAGIVGTSVASCMKELGCSRVVLIEQQSHCLTDLNHVDRDIAAYLESSLVQQQIEIITHCKINYVTDTASYSTTDSIQNDYRFIAVGTRRVPNTFVNTPSTSIIQLIERVSYGRKIQLGTIVDDRKGGNIVISKIPIIPIDYQRVKGACSIEEAVSIAYRTICKCFNQLKSTFFMPSFIYTAPSVLLIGQTRVPADDMFICSVYFPVTMKYTSNGSARGFGKLWISRTRPILCGVQMMSDYAPLLGKAFGILIRNRISLDNLCHRIELVGSIGEAVQGIIKQAMSQIQRNYLN